MNPMQLISQLTSAGNPAQMMNNLLSTNPQYQRVLQMVNGKSPNQMREVAMNLCKEQGIDFEQACNQMRQMGLKIPK